jgi:hypothetical protein
MDIRYPIGQFSFEGEITSAVLNAWISQLEDAPRLFREAVKGLSDVQLDSPYREGGWSPKQLVHHIADSNMNSYIRFKLAVTEDKPTVKPYDQTLWSELADARAFVNKLKEKENCLLSPGNTFGVGYDGFIRVPLVRPVPVLKDVVERVQSFLTGL